MTNTGIKVPFDKYHHPRRGTNFTRTTLLGESVMFLMLPINLISFEKPSFVSDTTPERVFRQWFIIFTQIGVE